jgi:rhodanese-related sulfurtransferase
MQTSTAHISLTPAAVHDALLRHDIVLVDVREDGEFQAEHIDGAIPRPLSAFDPAALPVDGNRQVVLCCARGQRSLKALARCREAGVPAHAHMEGGLAAWKEARLPTVG